MKFMIAADTQQGVRKNVNQDSLLVKHGFFQNDEVLLAIVCDGMGGLSKGEFASAAVVRRFSQWFDKELAGELKRLDMGVIGAKWTLLLKELNCSIIEHMKILGCDSSGTTFSGILFANNQYLIVHVGDTRIYKIKDKVEQLTEDQTLIAREVNEGNLTECDAKWDKRRNVLLQCVGASQKLEPQVKIGMVEKGVYMLCSDGFRHKITSAELQRSFHPENLTCIDDMKEEERKLIALAKGRNEGDDISVILIKVE